MNELTPQEKKLQQLQSAVDRVWKRAKRASRMDNIVNASVVVNELTTVASVEVMEAETE